MSVDVTFRIGGQAGQGLQTISALLGRMLVRGGYYVFTCHDVMSRIRGGHNFTDVRVSDRPVLTQRERCNMLVALDEQTIAEHREQLTDGGVIVADARFAPAAVEGRQVFALPIGEIAGKVGKDARMANSVALGGILNLTGYPLEPLLTLLKATFHDKPGDVIKRNLECARTGYDHARNNFKKTCPCKVLPVTRPVGRLYLTGAEAVGLSAVLSGLQFYAGYPMSPSTSIFEYIAAQAREHGILVLQGEDEIAAINMALGASVAGARAMTATSGGGFSLMTEGLSLAGMTETPIVIALGSRPGPATGMATRHAQADLLFALHAGHGEFDRVLLAPGTAEEAFYQTSRAFDLAERYQVPAIVLLDQHLLDSSWTVDAFDESRLARDRYAANPAGMAPYSYRRYALDPASPVSPLLRPGTRNQVRYDDSDEHDEDGHITESAETRRAMVQKRLGKLAAIRMELGTPEVYPDEKTKGVVLGFGSTFGVLREAVDRLRAQGLSLSMMHFSELHPFPRESVKARLSRVPRILTVENNATAQLARLLANETRLRITESILKFDGRPFCVEYVMHELERQLQ